MPGLDVLSMSVTTLTSTFKLMAQIHEYVYNRSRQPIGVLAAQAYEKNPDQVIIGWSLCNRRAGDRFDRQRGVQIAYQRSATGSDAGVPYSLAEQYMKFLNRSRRYFKNKSVIY